MSAIVIANIVLQPYAQNPIKFRATVSFGYRSVEDDFLAFPAPELPTFSVEDFTTLDDLYSKLRHTDLLSGKIDYIRQLAKDLEAVVRALPNLPPGEVAHPAPHPVV